MSKTPWTFVKAEYRIADADGNIVLDDCDCDDLELIVAAVNFYESLPEDVQKLSPETVAKCVAALSARMMCRNSHASEYMQLLRETQYDAIAALALEAKDE